MMLTINELAKKTGISTYEIRRRVHSGTLPHMRVGAKQTKILIDEDSFTQLLAEESVQNMEAYNQIISHNNSTDIIIGYGKLRKID